MSDDPRDTETYCHRCRNAKALCTGHAGPPRLPSPFPKTAKQLPGNVSRIVHETFKESPKTLPTNWDRMVCGAYLLGTGATVPEVAEAVGVTTMTIYNWTKRDDWHLAERDADTLWRMGIIAKTKQAIMESLDDPKDKANMARYVAHSRRGARRPAVYA